jgi:hypothetical protein
MKSKIFVLLLVCFLLADCTQKFENAQAEEIIKASLELTEKNSLEILGISMEAKDVALVKFKINDVQISSKMRKYDSGWQLDEVKNDFGMWIPAVNLIKSFSQAEKQKTAMIDIRVISIALAVYVTDNGEVPTQDGIYSKDGSFYYSLSPFYVKELPIKDPWGNNYRVYCGKVCNRHYGISEAMADDFVVVSYGRNGEREMWEFDPSNPEAGLFVIGDASDFDKDLIMWNGIWIRSPRIGMK